MQNLQRGSARAILDAAASGESWPRTRRERAEPSTGRDPALRGGRSEPNAEICKALLGKLDSEGERGAFAERGIYTNSTVQIDGVELTDTLDLRALNIEKPALFRNCIFPHGVQLEDAILRLLVFENCEFSNIDFFRAQIRTSLVIANGDVRGGVDGSEATIGGQLSLAGTRIEGAPDLLIDHAERVYAARDGRHYAAINLSNVRVAETVYLDNMLIRGEIDFENASIGGQLKLDSTTLCKNENLIKRPDAIPEDRDAGKINPYLIWGEGARIERSFTMREATLEGGCIRLTETKIGGQFNAERAQLRAFADVHDWKDWLGDAEGAQADAKVLHNANKLTLTIFARGARFSRSIVMRECQCVGMVWLQDAVITGRFTGEASKFSGLPNEAAAINCEGIEVGRSFILDRASCNGSVLIEGALLKGRFEAGNASFSLYNPDPDDKSPSTRDPRALSMELSEIGGVFLAHCTTFGKASFTASNIKGLFQAGGASFSNAGNSSNSVCLSLNGATVQQSVFLRSTTVKSFISEGCVDLRGASIDGALEVLGVLNAQSAKVALNASNLKVRGSANLDITADGMIDLKGATIDGALTIRGELDAKEAEYAVRAHDLVVEDSVQIGLEETAHGAKLAFSANGKVSFKQARIKSSLYIVGCLFQNPLFGQDKSKGSFLETFSQEGRERARQRRERQKKLKAYEHERQLELRRDTALDLSLIRVETAIIMEDFHAVKGHVNLRNAYTRVLRDDWTLWSARKGKAIDGHVILDNFQYDKLHVVEPAEELLEWTNCQPDEHLDGDVRLQPLTQLADVLDANGYEVAARDMRHKRERLRVKGYRRWEYKLVGWFMEGTVGHSYNPVRGVYWSLAFIALGTLVYAWAWDAKMVRPSVDEAVATIRVEDWRNLPEDYPTFNPIIYSLDRFLPVLSFGQEDKWSIRTRPQSIVIQDERDHKPNTKYSDEPIVWRVSGFKVFSIAQKIFGWLLTVLTGIAITERYLRRK